MKNMLSYFFENTASKLCLLHSHRLVTGCQFFYLYLLHPIIQNSNVLHMTYSHITATDVLTKSIRELLVCTSHSPVDTLPVMVYWALKINHLILSICLYFFPFLSSFLLFSFIFFFLSYKYTLKKFHVIFILSASLPSCSPHFHTRHLQEWMLQTALYTSDI